MKRTALSWPGGDLLSHVLRRSTIGAESFHGRVRDGIGCLASRYGHQAGKLFCHVNRGGSVLEGRMRGWVLPLHADGVRWNAVPPLRRF